VGVRGAVLVHERRGAGDCRSGDPIAREGRGKGDGGVKSMKVLKITALVVLVYVGVVVAFESFMGFLQPRDGSTLVITTFDGDGTPHDRVLSRLESDGQLYVAANHWPRAWYNRALENPDVQVTQDGEKGDYRAVPVTGAEHDRVERENSHGVAIRILTGFPPRYFVRLDPR
jgi:hypothetical protein